MKKLRMLCNMMIDIDREGVITRELIRFGQLYSINYVQISDDPEFVDIYLEDGGIIRGINRALMELNQVEVKEYVPPEESNNATVISTLI